VAFLEEQQGVVHVRVGALERHAHDQKEFAAMIPALVEAITEIVRQPDRLTTRRLVVGSRYRVLRDLLGAKAGDVLRYTGKVVDWHADAERFDFRHEHDDAALDLFEAFDADLAILRELHLYMEPIA
jgi:hypothetical protein